MSKIRAGKNKKRIVAIDYKQSARQAAAKAWKIRTDKTAVKSKIAELTTEVDNQFTELQASYHRVSILKLLILC